MIVPQYTPSNNFTMKLVEKSLSISSKHGSFKMLFKPLRKKFFEQNYNFGVIICFCFSWV